jgi:hypothetical protein
MNDVQEGHVIDDLIQLAQEANWKRISIHWIPECESEQVLTPRVLPSVAYRRKWLPRHIDNSGASIDAILEFRTDIFLKPNQQVEPAAPARSPMPQEPELSTRESTCAPAPLLERIREESPSRT